MSLMLAPYNDSMRLGMGFNSYTQTICCDKAVSFSDGKVNKDKKPSQVVTYSSKCVSRLADIVKSMNVSYSSSIKKGTVEIAGNNTAVNEEKIKESDVSAVISVKVVNQTEIIDETCEFKPIPGILPGNPDFDDAFGDCFISGWITGGDLNAIVSMKVLDRSKVDSVVSDIEKAIGNGASKADFNLDIDAFSSNVDNSRISQETETTISVSWMGGGQIKDPSVPWDLNSVYQVAAAFPSYVAETPQKTWAILTKYKANRSFREQMAKAKATISPLEYDLVISYTADMFDNYMDYKQLVKLVQDIIDNPKSYEPRNWKKNAIPVSIPTLVAVKMALRLEMTKIVRAVDLIARDPEVLQRQSVLDAEPSDSLVQRIIRQALNPLSEEIQDPTIHSLKQQTMPSSKLTASTSTEPATSSTTSAPPEKIMANTSQPTLDLNSMIAPEIWADLLPEPQADSVIAAEYSSLFLPDGLAAMVPPPPGGEYKPIGPTSNQNNALKILIAVCGLTDVTDTMSNLIGKDNTLRFRASAITGLLNETNPLSSKITLYLSFIYQFGNQPPRLVVAKPETSNSSITDPTTIYNITWKSTEFPIVEPTEWNADTFAIGGFIYGAKNYSGDSEKLKKLVETFRNNYNGGRGRRSVRLSDQLVGEDPWPGMTKMGVLFYQLRAKGKFHASVGIEGKQPFFMTDRLVNDLVFPLYTELDPQIEANGSRIAVGIFKIEGLRDPSKPFLRFPNGVMFHFRPDGNFYVKRSGKPIWQAFEKVRPVFDPTINPHKWVLEWNGWGLQILDDQERTVWDATFDHPKDNNVRLQVYFSDRSPFIEIGSFEDDSWSSLWRVE